MSEEQYHAALNAIRDYGEWARAHPAEARQVLIDSGIYTAEGALAPAYGGPGAPGLD